jgi:5'-nucleotidase
VFGRRAFVKWLRLALLLSLACLAGSGSIAADAPQAYRILVTNDDGIRAPGILALAQALRAVGDISVVAPSDNQTAKGHAISITDPIYADPVDLPGGIDAMALTATPASCVKVALASLLKEKPDLVVSGINRGTNLGLVEYVSGTVAAAREAAMQGIPAIASSLETAGHPDYAAAAEVTVRVARLVKAGGLARGVFLNVNVPAGKAGELKGLRVTRQSELAGLERFEERKTPGGRRYFWNIWEEPTTDTEGSDVWAVLNKYAAVTPLRVGEFDAKAYEALKRALR